MLSKKLATVDKTRCVACGVCENTCPLGAVKVRHGCYAAVEEERLTAVLSHLRWEQILLQPPINKDNRKELFSWLN